MKAPDLPYRSPARVSRLGRIAATTALLLSLGSSFAAADVKLAPLFSNGAVLQQKKPVPVWGVAAPGEAVSVSFANQSVRTTAGSDGRWSVTLEPMDANATAQTLRVQGKNTINVQNVLVGEVWLCSGQSNMEWLVKRSANAEQEIARANYPLIRQIKIERNPSEKPTDTAPGRWQVCTPQTVGDFTAVGYYFALSIYKELGIPVGLISSSWSGTNIEPWISEEGLQGVSSYKDISERWQKVAAGHPARVTRYKQNLAKWEADRAKAQQEGVRFTTRRPLAPEGPGSRRQPSALYNGMIAPLVPYSLAGVLWYQGESNATRHTEYKELFKAMIKQWRADFKQPELPFYFVQLANFNLKSDESGNRWAYLREAQTGARELPATGMAVAIDIGEANDIHPGNKQDVGARLARLALRNVYNKSNIVAEGPRFEDVRFTGKQAWIKFSHAEGLNSGDQPLTGFELAGADQKFYPAQAVIDGDTVALSAESVQKPVAVRYAWANYPEPPATLRNAAQLPAEPFRTDNW